MAGVTAFFSAPAEAPHRPRVRRGFSTANFAEIVRLQPDLVITFSDVQAELAAGLVKRGLTVLATNQRTLAETETTLALVARVVGCEAAAEKLLAEFRQRLAPVKTGRPRPRVYFEEWNEPCITGIAWVGEMIERAGGEDIFAGLRARRSAPERVVTTGTGPAGTARNHLCLVVRKTGPYGVLCQPRRLVVDMRRRAGGSHL